MRIVAARFAGVVFAIGLGLAGMTQPQKVLAFLDVTGDWDPSLAFVMAAALLVDFAAFRFILRQPKPLFDGRFHLPLLHAIDAKLLGGAALFGAGWGLSGYCPGPALVALTTGQPEAWVFGAAMVLGMGLGQDRGATALQV